MLFLIQLFCFSVWHRFSDKSSSPTPQSMHTHKQLKRALLGGCVFLSLSTFAQNSQQKSEVPKFSSDAEKQQWIAAHPDEYVEAGGTLQSAAPANSEAISQTPAEQKEKAQQPVSQPQVNEVDNKDVPAVASAKAEDPTFPVYVNTGNPERDAASYELRKKEWYENHPAPIHVSKSEFAALTPEKQQTMLKDPNFIVEQ